MNSGGSGFLSSTFVDAYLKQPLPSGGQWLVLHTNVLYQSHKIHQNSLRVVAGGTIIGMEEGESTWYESAVKLA